MSSFAGSVHFYEPDQLMAVMDCVPIRKKNWWYSIATAFQMRPNPATLAYLEVRVSVIHVYQQIAG